MGTKNIVRLLIKAGANNNTNDNTYNAISTASIYGHPAILKMLVQVDQQQKQVALELEQQQKQAALLYACLKSDEECLKILLSSTTNTDAN